MATPDEIAAGAVAELEETPEVAESTPAVSEQDNFSDDDLDPEKIETGLKSKTLNLDNSGLLKRFKKVHGRYKEDNGWRKANEPKLKQFEAQGLAVQRLLNGVTKLRSKDKPNEQGFLENLLDALMEDKGKPDWKAAHEAIGRLVEEADGQAANSGKAVDPEVMALKAKFDALEAEAAKQKAEVFQNNLNVKVRDAFNGIPKHLDGKDGFKGLPWKNQEWRKEFEGFVDKMARAWGTENEADLISSRNPNGKIPPFNEIAEQVAKLYLRGGSEVLKRQMQSAATKSKLKLTDSSGPGGTQTRKLPTKGDTDSELEYLKGLTGAVEEEMAQGN